MPQIHPTALVDPSAELADDVIVGPGCIIEEQVRIGPGCRFGAYAIVRRYTEMGANNSVDSFAVLGGEPQDRKFDPATTSYLRIGDDNTFRESVTISRATGEGNATVVGNRTYWMAGAHAGHNARIDDEAILVNGSMVAGHAHIGPRVILSGSAMVHQFCWIGELVMSQGGCAASQHVPPYCLIAAENFTVGLNVVGLRRSADISDDDIEQIREAYALLYRRGLPLAEALSQMHAHTEWGPAAGKFREFCQAAYEAEPPYNRGLVARRRGRR